MSGARKYNFEPEDSLSRSFVLASKLQPSMLDISRFKRARRATPPQTIDNVIKGLFEQLDQEIIIPILRSQDEKEFIKQFKDKIKEFYYLRHSLIFAFNSYVYKSKIAKDEYESFEKKYEEDVKECMLNEAKQIIGNDAVMAVLYSISTMKKVNDSLSEELAPDFFEKHINIFHEIDIDKTNFDLFMSCLLRVLMKDVTFDLNRDVLRGLALFTEKASTRCYINVMKIGLIKYPKPKTINLKHIKSHQEDIELAEAGIGDYLKILEREDTE